MKEELNDGAKISGWDKLAQSSVDMHRYQSGGEHIPICYSNTSIPEAPMPMHQVTTKCVFEIMDYEV